MSGITAHPNPLRPGQTPKIEDLLAGPTVTMLFPQKVLLRLDNGAGLLEFHAGVQEVPESLADHWWLRDNGVRRHVRPTVESAADMNLKPTAPRPDFVEFHAEFLRSMGYKNVQTVEDVGAFYDKLPSNDQKSSFLCQAVDWNDKRRKAAEEKKQKKRA